MGGISADRLFFKKMSIFVGANNTTEVFMKSTYLLTANTISSLRHSLCLFTNDLVCYTSVWSSERFYRGHTFLYSFIIKRGTDTRAFYVVGNYISNSINFEILDSRGVVYLFSLACPSAVIWRITLVIINSIKTMFLSRFTPHVLNKIIEPIYSTPSITYGNAPATVEVKLPIRFVVTSAFSSSPTIPFARVFLGKSMRFIHVINIAYCTRYVHG